MRFQEEYPAAVACLRNDLHELVTCFRYKSKAERPGVRTTNAVHAGSEKCDDGPGGWVLFQDKTSMDRILFAVSQGVSTPFLLTQNN